MSGLVFVDASVLVYARDSSEPVKQKRASEWVAHLWQSRSGRLSFQVIQEYYSTVTTKLRPGMDPESARGDARALVAWRPVLVDARLVEGAWLAQDRYRLAWWDALILSAAQAAGCRFLLSEDLADGQTYDRVLVVNPFARTPSSLR